MEEFEKSGELNFGYMASFTTYPSLDHVEFGDYLIAVNRKEFCQRYECIDTIYNFEWLRQRPRFLSRITGMTEEEWLEWGLEDLKKSYPDEIPNRERIFELIDDEINYLYGWEREVIIRGDDIKVYPIDVVMTQSLDEFCDRKRELIYERGKGWYNEPYRHALASRGIRTR